MPKRLSLKEPLERREPIAADRPKPSGSPMNAVIRLTAPLTEPVTLVRRLIDVGLSLRKAHDVLNRVAAGEEVAVILPAVADAHATATALAKLGATVEWQQPIE